MVVLEALVVGVVSALVVRHVTREDRDERRDEFSLLRFWFFWPSYLVELVGKAIAWFVRGVSRFVQRHWPDAKE